MKAHWSDGKAAPASSSGATPAAQQVARWGLLVAVVVVLTVLFSFLGTITCAVLAGMTFGTMRHRRWQALLASLVFPAVVLVLLHLSRSELLLQKRLVMASLCFGAFWVTYGLTLLVLLLEDHGEAEAAQPNAETAPALSLAAAGAAVEIGLPSEVQDEGRAVGADDVSLRQFQGRWWCDLTVEGGSARRRRIDIGGDRFELGILNGDGQVHILATGEVKVERIAGVRTLTFTTGPDGAPEDRKTAEG